jgi:subtilisin family serine protease
MREGRLHGISTGILVVSLVVLFGCTGVAGRPDDQATLPKQLQARQVIVTLAEATPQQWESTTRALSARYQLPEAGNFPLNSIRVQCAVFQVPPQRPVQDVVEQLRTDPRVESVEPNQVFEGAQTQRVDPYAGFEYGSAAIRADVAHRISTGKGVRVTVVDTGVDIDHPALRGRIVKTANFVDGGESSFTSDRHGTAVAGVIGARTTGAVSILGIAPDAEIVAAKACWYADKRTAKALCSSWTLAKAIDFAIGAGTQVLNLSLSGPADALLGRLLIAADARGITVVAAAAEGATDAGFPAALGPVVAVVASDTKGQVQLPAWLDHKRAIAAPGVDILTTTPRGSYDFLSGSSLAAAHVTGVVALLLEQRPKLAPSDIRDLLQLTVHPVLTTSGALAPTALGLVDACAALGKLLTGSACPIQ